MGVIYCAKCNQKSSLEVDRCSGCGEDTRLDGRYRLLSVLGRGAFGTTWLGRRIEDRLEVAIKELLIRSLDSFKTYDLFNREVALLRSLLDHATPAYHDHFQVGQGRQLGLYLVTEYIDGPTLAEELRERRYTPREVLLILREILVILDRLHHLAPPVVHRDLKPANVMRRQSDGGLVLIDFGSVKEVARVGDGGSTVAGTFGYMAPEQFAGRATPASDLYALGVIGLELITRQPPQAFLDDRNVLVWEPLVRDPDLRALLASVLEVDPLRRAADAGELARLVDALLAGRDLPGAVGQRIVGAGADANALLVDSGIVGQSKPPEGAPRPLPRGFARRVDAQAHSLRVLGAWLGAAPVLLGGASLLSDGLMAMLFAGLTGLAGNFGFLAGVALLVLGQTRLSRKARIWRRGVACKAVVTQVDPPGAHNDGGARWCIHYRYRGPDGHVAEGSIATRDVPLEYRVVGASIWALVEPSVPSQSVAYWD